MTAARDDERIARDVDVYILDVVLARAAHVDEVLATIRVGRKACGDR